MIRISTDPSYNKGMAKLKLYSWLFQVNSNSDSCVLEPFAWRQNYGVFIDLLFHEKDDVYYFENSEGLKPNNELNFNDCLQWFYPGFDRGKILFKPDIAIFHKGQPKIFIEIVDKDHVDKDKIRRIQEFMGDLYFELYEVDASDIQYLSDDEIPDKIHHIQVI